MKVYSYDHAECSDLSNRTLGSRKQSQAASKHGSSGAVKVGLLFKICELLTSHGVDICTSVCGGVKRASEHFFAQCFQQGSANINTENGVAACPQGKSVHTAPHPQELSFFAGNLSYESLFCKRQAVPIGADVAAFEVSNLFQVRIARPTDTAAIIEWLLGWRHLAPNDLRCRELEELLEKTKGHGS